VELAEEFRCRAQRCLNLAHQAPTLEAQTHWLAMAQLWFSLAEHAEEQDAQFLGQSAPHFRSEDSGENDRSSEGDGEENP
jgi:hypothetical protein